MPSSTPRLSEVARHVIYPETVATSGWPRVRAQCAEMGVSFDAWQEGVGTIALGKDLAGKYAATVGGVVLSIPRQVGKTFLVGMIQIAMCVLYPGYRVLWTAHHGRTTTLTFQTMQGMARRKRIWPHVESIRMTNGEQEIRFKNGSVIMFGAREFGFGRGFDGVDAEVFDEAQKLTSSALEDMVPATNQARHEAGALLWFMGTPPRGVDAGEEFTARRKKALAGKAVGMVYVEFSADADADPNDRAQWSLANPSFPSRTPVESVERMREQLTDDASFLKEGLGVWDETQSKGVIPADAWADRLDADSIATGSYALGIEVAPDMASASVVMAGQRDDGAWHVEVARSSAGASWVQAYVQRIVEQNDQLGSVVVDVAGPVAAILDKRGETWRLGDVRVTPIKVAELGVACMTLRDGVVSGWLRHMGDPFLNIAVQSAGKRDLGDTGRWVFSRKSTTSDITPIQSAALALWGAQNSSSQVKRPLSRQGKGRKVVSW